MRGPLPLAGGSPFVCHPPLAAWADAIEANRAQVPSWSFSIAGVPAAELRARARRRVLEIAGMEDDGRPLVVTGHQPVFYHPGVWIKAFAVTGQARCRDWRAVNLTVDHDAAELAAEVPFRSGDELRYTKEFLVIPQSGRPLESLPPPAPEQVAQFVARVEERLASLDWSDGAERFRRFAQALRDACRTAPHAAGVGVLSRRGYERSFGETLCPDVSVAETSAAPEFLLFFVHWAVHARELQQAYNRALALFRAEHRVRSAANPFPDLRQLPDGSVELPFWGVTGAGIRRKLYARRKGGDIELVNLEGVFAKMPAKGGGSAVEAIIASGARVRPKAVPLTVFYRLFVADLFVHGTGGGRYDQVTDALISDYFGIRPPAFGVVSASLYLPLGVRPVPPTAISAQRRKLRDLVFNPQRYAWEAGDVDEELARLLARKEELIQAINEPGAARRALTREIEAVNRALGKKLAPVAAKAQEELSRLKARARSAAVAWRRTYPFFLFAPGSLWELLSVPAGGPRETLETQGG
ncbi:MAG: hypothetical protein H0Z37_07995 [Firmicutes bacterium]|nr:hypothetical protein [Bacillota bacterium]